MEIGITGMGDEGGSEKIERASAALDVYDIDGEEGCLAADEGGETDVAERAMPWMSFVSRAILSAMEARSLRLDHAGVGGVEGRLFNREGDGE